MTAEEKIQAATEEAALAKKKAKKAQIALEAANKRNNRNTLIGVAVIIAILAIGAWVYKSYDFPESERQVIERQAKADAEKEAQEEAKEAIAQAKIDAEAAAQAAAEARVAEAEAAAKAATEEAQAKIAAAEAAAKAAAEAAEEKIADALAAMQPAPTVPPRPYPVGVQVPTGGQQVSGNDRILRLEDFTTVESNNQQIARGSGHNRQPPWPELSGWSHFVENGREGLIPLRGDTADGFGRSWQGIPPYVPPGNPQGEWGRNGAGDLVYWLE